MSAIAAATLFSSATSTTAISRDAAELADALRDSHETVLAAGDEPELAPSRRAKRQAVASPMPLDAPVTTTEGSAGSVQGAGMPPVSITIPGGASGTGAPIVEEGRPTRTGFAPRRLREGNEKAEWVGEDLGSGGGERPSRPRSSPPTGGGRECASGRRRRFPCRPPESPFPPPASRGRRRALLRSPGSSSDWKTAWGEVMPRYIFRFWCARGIFDEMSRRLVGSGKRASEHDRGGAGDEREKDVLVVRDPSVGDDGDFDRRRRSRPHGSPGAAEPRRRSRAGSGSRGPVPRRP